MMFKIGTCGLCQRVYRTGGLRQLIQREMLSGFNRNVVESQGVRKTAFSESRIVVCNECYKKLEKGEGVNTCCEDVLDGDLLGYKQVSDEFEVKVSKPSKGKGSMKLTGQVQKKERKPRGKRVVTKGSTIAKSLASSTFEDEDTDEKPNKEKKQRKVKATAEPTIPVVDIKDNGGVEVTELSSEGFRDSEGNPPPIVPPPSEEPEPVEEVSVTNKDRKQYKEQVRQALTSSPEIMYSEIARRLNIDEGLVSQLVNEIDGEV